MRRILFLLIILATFSCQSIDKQNSIAQYEALNSGVRIDTIFMGITFHDTPSEFKNKINKLMSEGYRSVYDRFEYSFKYPTELENYKWTMDGWRTSFYNDTLCRFTLRLEMDDLKWKYGNWFAPLDSLFTYKYGEPVRDKENFTFNWYKGNLEIEIYGVDYDSNSMSDEVLISYKNSLKMHDFYIAPKRFKPEKGNGIELCYSLDYWNKVYAKADSILVDDAAKDI